MEVAEAYHARAGEMEMAIHHGEIEGYVPKGGHVYKFRTGELRTFQEVCKRSIEVGSRRITVMENEARMREGR